MLKIPVGALSEKGDDGKPVSPEAGDEVTFEVTGKVVKVDGDSAHVDIQSANGEPASYSDMSKEIEYEEEGGEMSGEDDGESGPQEPAATSQEGNASDAGNERMALLKKARSFDRRRASSMA